MNGLTRKYLVYRNGLLYTRCLTLIKAKSVVNELRSNGFSASVAEVLEDAVTRIKSGSY